jgi:hypothetical protein
MTRHLPAAISVALVFIAIGVVPRPALAGGYDVYACDASIAVGANRSWGAAADGGMTAYTDCPEGSSRATCKAPNQPPSANPMRLLVTAWV